MANAGTIDKAAVVGTGLIGAAWATLFLANGVEVVAVDPDPDAPAKLAADVRRMAEGLKAAGVAVSADVDPALIRFAAVPGPELEGAGLVQENAPERLELKREILARVEAFVGPDALLASSTTALLVSDIQTACRHPERVIAAHPLNPPHLMPLVEISGGRSTSSEALDRAMALYAALGKKPVRLAREIEGHIAGRLSAALWREAVHLVEQGVATVADVDAAVVHGPGLRWAAIGPHMTYHAGGGAGGIDRYLDTLGASQERRWATLGSPTLDENLKRRIAEGVHSEADGRSVDEIADERDRRLAVALKAFAD